MSANNIYYRRWIRLIGAISTFLALICFFPAIGDICTILYYNDTYINYAKYQKKHIIIDSLEYSADDPESRVDGYSKNIDNYKTVILLNKTRDEESEIDSVGNIHMDVWHRNGIDFAYPARKEDKTLPAKKIFYQRAKVPLFWFLTILVTFIMYKIMKKSKIFEEFDS